MQEQEKINLPENEGDAQCVSGDGISGGAPDEEQCMTLSSAWEFLSFSFRYPGTELIDAIMSGEWAAAANELAEALELDLPEDWDSGLDLSTFGPELANPSFESRADTSAETRQQKEALHRLRAEATRLFIGSPDPAVSPYEGIWRAKDDSVMPLLFVNPHSMDVERFMKSCGIVKPEGVNEPLDHISTECEFMECLCLVRTGQLPEMAALNPPEG
ncbi:MAG: molecular chaperone TorD family protein [Eggerthellaceae bacterium]|nr:molecular chaperone TorD family protein [Eggerthellaceae bacterium]